MYKTENKTLNESPGRDQIVNNKFSKMTIGASFIKQFLPITCNQNNYLYRFYTFRKELINSVLIKILFFLPSMLIIIHAKYV